MMIFKNYIYLFSLLLIANTTPIWGQKKGTPKKEFPLFVPYKVKDKFGIANEKGDLVIAPQFDYISVYDVPNFFTCFTYDANKRYQTSLVVNDKVILSNQPYFGYFNNQNIVFAAKEIGGKGSGYYSLRPEEIDLYTIKGKRITPESFIHASIFEDFDKENTLPQVVLYLMHRDKTYSLVLYDKKTATITTTFVNKAYDIEFERLEMLSDTKELHLKYVDMQQKGHELKIGIKGKSFVKTFEGTYNVQHQKDAFSFDDHVVAVPDWDSEKQPKPTFTESEINSKKLEIRKDYQTYQPSKLLFLSHKLDPKYQKLFFENEKKGLMNTYENKVILPAIYDEFYSADFKGIHASGFVLKQDGKYRLKVYNFGGKESSVKGVFEQVPMITFFEYGRKDFHLISLFDENGKFICYANQDGKVYFRE